MTTNKNSAKAADIIIDFKFDPEDFPELIKRLLKKNIRYNLHETEWNKAEERVWGNY